MTGYSTNKKPVSNFSMAVFDIQFDIDLLYHNLYAVPLPMCIFSSLI
jgi:hypothetical protein